jgi:hypothetical protein
MEVRMSGFIPFFHQYVFTGYTGITFPLSLHGKKKEIQTPNWNGDEWGGGGMEVCSSHRHYRSARKVKMYCKTL